MDKDTLLLKVKVTHLINTKLVVSLIKSRWKDRCLLKIRIKLNLIIQKLIV
jgi:hypothetical protein